MILKAYCWYDKVDKTYLADSFLLHRSERSVCRGFLNQFERDKKMNVNEYDLYQIGIFDDEKGTFEPLPSPVKVDVTQVYVDQPNTKGEVVDE